MFGVIGIFDNPIYYELAIREEMKKMEATKEDFDILNDDFIWNNMIERRLPKDVAWAVMQ